VKFAASLSQGSGGGKGVFAQGGTQDLSKIDLVKKELINRL
jgi:alanyl-tRNA synthetase